MIDILVSSEWVKDHLDDDRLIFFDIRSPREYDNGHLPNSVLIPYEKILDFSPNKPFFDIADKTTIEQLLSENGVDNDTQIIVYGDKGGSTASRLFWTLLFYGADVKFLDISYSKWLDLGYPVTTEIYSPRKTTFVANENPDNFRVNSDYVLSKIQDQNTVILDTRSKEEYRGLIAAGPKAGRIPNSKNFPWENAIGINGNIFHTAEELSNIFDNYGLQNKEIICYCQVGERASHTFLALKICGYSDVKIYDRSFADWSNNSNLPIEL